MIDKNALIAFLAGYLADDPKKLDGLIEVIDSGLLDAIEPRPTILPERLEATHATP